MNNVGDLIFFEKEKLLENLCEYFLEYIIHEDEFYLSADFYKDFECNMNVINSIESFHEAFMSDPVEPNTYKIHLSNGDTKYLEVKIVKRATTPAAVTYYGFINDVTNKKIYEEELHYYAYKDMLTGISNRRQLMGKLEDAVKNSWNHDISGAFVFIDLDGFKAVNDQLGHKCGDEVLVEISDRIRKIIPENIEFGRLGGDEFAIIIPNTEMVNVPSFCERLCNEVASASSYFGMKISVAASIGISLFPNDSFEINRIVDLADRAMYMSKAKGKNKYTFWSELAQDKAYNHS